MAVSLLEGLVQYSGSRENDGHRTYKVVHYVRSDDMLDGPANVMQCPGIPLPGDVWNFGNDIDVWAFCRLGSKVNRHDAIKDGEKVEYWTVEQEFSTKPDRLCRLTAGGFDDPILEPMKIGGSMIKEKKEATYDRFGERILNSAFEQMRGPTVEFDESRAQVTVEQNVPNLSWAFCSGMVNCVNGFPIWGLPPRCVKLDDFTWDQKWYGTCNYYFTRKFTFSVSYEVREFPDDPLTVPDETEWGIVGTFDRDLLDEGTKVIRGFWQTDPSSPQYRRYVVENGIDNTNPANFVRFKDATGENTRCLLNGFGYPLDTDPLETGTGTSGDEQGVIPVEKYLEADFSLLGIPTTIG